jgi:hypothetical protein
VPAAGTGGRCICSARSITAAGSCSPQTPVSEKTDEITAFVPLPERIDRACPLTGAVITAGALYTRTDTPTGRTPAARTTCSS